MSVLPGVPDIGRFESLSEFMEYGRPCCGDKLCDKHLKDEIWGKKMKVCWSLSTSREWYGQLPEQSADLRQLIQIEELLLYQRAMEPEKWARFRMLRQSA